MGSELMLWHRFRIMCRLVLIDLVHNADSIQLLQSCNSLMCAFSPCLSPNLQIMAPPLGTAQYFSRSLSHISFRKTEIILSHDALEFSF